MDSDKVFAKMCENCHGQNGVGGEVKEAEPVGVHDVAKEFRERRAEPVVEEQREKGIPVRSQSRSGGWEYPRARMRSRLHRPEEVVVLPQLLRTELRGEDRPLLPQRREPLPSADFTPFPLSAFGAMAEVVGEVDGVGGAGGNGGQSAALFQL